MDYRASLVIPAKENASGTITQEMELGEGTITRVRISIPAGHRGLAHMRIFRFEHQLYPTTPGTYYQGDDEVVVIDDSYLLAAVPYTLRLEGYNTDDTYPHTFEISVTLRAPVPELTPPTGAAAVFAALLGA